METKRKISETELSRVADEARELAMSCRNRRAKNRFDLSLQTELELMSLSSSVRGTWAAKAVDTHLRMLRSEMDEITARAADEAAIEKCRSIAAGCRELEATIADLKTELVRMGYSNE